MQGITSAFDVNFGFFLSTLYYNVRISTNTRIVVKISPIIFTDKWQNRIDYSRIQHFNIKVYLGDTAIDPRTSLVSSCKINAKIDGAPTID